MSRLIKGWLTGLAGRGSPEMGTCGHGCFCLGPGHRPCPRAEPAPWVKCLMGPVNAGITPQGPAPPRVTSALIKIHELTDSWHVTARSGTVGEYSRTDCGSHQTPALSHAPNPANSGFLSHLDQSQAPSPSAHLPCARPLALLPRVVGAARLLPGVSPLHLQPKTAVFWALFSEKFHCPHKEGDSFHCPLPSSPHAQLPSFLLNQGS